jgi:hypothetical protein
MKIPPKLRGFIVDKDSGHPLPGVAVLAVAELAYKSADPVDPRGSSDGRDKGAEGFTVSLPLGMLASDAAGYVSFDVKSSLGEHIPPNVKHLWVVAVGDDTIKTDALARPQAGAFNATTTPATQAAVQATQVALYNPSPSQCVPFILKADAKLANGSTAQTRLASIQNPDRDDWELSPYSFVTKNDLKLGADGCVVPVPFTGAEREFRLTQVVRTAPPTSGAPVRELKRNPPPGFKLSEPAGSRTSIVRSPGVLAQTASSGFRPVSIAPLDPFADPWVQDSMPITFGRVLEFRQAWIPMGHALGGIVYSLPLAPCESVNIAVIDWSRKDYATRSDSIVSKEGLSHSQRRDRIIDESVEAALGESQGGWSLMGGVAGAESVGASATVPIEGIPVDLSFARSIVGSLGGAIANSWGNRDLTGESLQELHDKIVQTTNVRRSLQSTVIVQATQDERNYLETRTITNHNHCHALTIQFYEVLRYFKVVTEFVRSRPVVLIPFKVHLFTRPEVQRFQTILKAALLERELLPCFDAVVRLRQGVGYDLEPQPQPQQGDKAGRKKPTTEPKIGEYYLTLDSTLMWADPRGAIRVELLVEDQWWILWEKVMKKFGGGTLRRPQHEEVVRSGSAITLGLRPAQIKQVRVSWFENDGEDFWDFKGIRIDYTLDNKPERHTLIRERGSAVPPGSKSNEPALKWFDDGDEWHQWVATVPPPKLSNDTEKTEDDSGKTGTTDTDGDGQGGRMQPRGPTKAADEYCSARLLAHLNSNLGYYNRAIWLLQDPTERVIMLNQALASYPDALERLDTTPIAVSGNYVAFPFTAQPTEAEQEQEGQRLAELPPRQSIMSLPTRGVFAETHLSHCSACEVRDVTRYWKWDESPCPKPPSIEGITPGPKGEPLMAEPTTLPSPVVQVMQPPAAPDPVGLAAALKLLGQPDIFRNMSGLPEVSALLTALSSGVVDLAGAQQLAKDAQAAIQRESWAAARGPAAEAQTFEPDPSKQVDRLQAIRQAADAGLISDEEATTAARRVLGAGEGYGEGFQLDGGLRSGRPSSNIDGPSAQLASAPMSDIYDWEDLLRFRPPQQIVSALSARNMRVQVFEEATGPDVNLDYYPILVTKLPSVNGQQLTGEQLMRTIRMGIAGQNPIFLDGSLSTFEPYDADDNTKWTSANPLGSVLFIDVAGPDNAAVVMTAFQDESWRFSTATTPRTGQHPVTGNREFAFVETTPGSYKYYTRGADRSSGYLESQAAVDESLTYAKGDQLWRSFQQRVAAWVAAHDGVAKVQARHSQRYRWAYVRSVLKLPMRL